MLRTLLAETYNNCLGKHCKSRGGGSLRSTQHFSHVVCSQTISIHTHVVEGL